MPPFRQNDVYSVSSQQAMILASRIEAKKAELENLSQLRDLSNALAMRMEALEKQLSTLKDGTEAIACVLSNWQNVLQAINMVSRHCVYNAVIITSLFLGFFSPPGIRLLPSLPVVTSVPTYKPEATPITACLHTTLNNIHSLVLSLIVSRFTLGFVQQDRKQKEKAANMATGWALDFCLVCDQQTPGNEVYCSQGCRLADLDQEFSTSSPKHSADSQHKSVYRRQSPPVDQESLASLLKVATSRRQATSKASSRPRYESSVHSPTSGSSQSSSLESSSSLLASSSSSSSNQIKHELHDYTGYFDPVRDWKRRQMSS
ncbi:hypothetical protein PISL3812_02631 [Talaromyces islandicus]|uniref:DASH complex subunit DAD2 n=1 Tax=Talaromyces islandicus TaxID=28573 RepID=A0A0U1LSP8_TALIS|nr:hypothetical protein PISL3812_02631 [Talaromyces islandicus]